MSGGRPNYRYYNLAALFFVGGGTGRGGGGGVSVVAVVGGGGGGGAAAALLRRRRRRRRRSTIKTTPIATPCNTKYLASSTDFSILWPLSSGRLREVNGNREAECLVNRGDLQSL